MLHYTIFLDKTFLLHRQNVIFVTGLYLAVVDVSHKRPKGLLTTAPAYANRLKKIFKLVMTHN
jgi:hypothetical protein